MKKIHNNLDVTLHHQFINSCMCELYYNININIRSFFHQQVFNEIDTMFEIMYD